MALSWSSVGMGCAGGNDSYWGCGSITVDRDGVVADVSGDGRAGGDDSYWACGTSLLKDEVFSLSSRTMVVPAAVVSAERATSLLTAAVLSLSSEAVAATVTAATVS